MKKSLALILGLLMVMTVFTGCKKEEAAGNYKDGTYFAAEKEFASSGWKSTVTLEVKDGKIVSVDWNAVSSTGGVDKKTASKNGSYGMVAKGNAQAEWHEQAAKVEAYLLEKQDPKAIKYIDDEGHTDAISGVSIHVNDFFKLVEEALAQGPVEKGPYKDGSYHAEAAEFSNGWKATVDITVMYGKIMAVNWDSISESDPAVTKKAASADGSYGMVAKGGAQAEWHEQAAKAEAYLIQTQDPKAIKYSDNEGHTDAISGVSIHVNEFFDLAEQALANAK